jgi:hypothetical protein
MLAYYRTMPQGDNGERVRPIEYTPDGTFSPEITAGREPRAWLALALSAIAVFVAVGAVSVLG